jgi:hypothetical protein
MEFRGRLLREPYLYTSSGLFATPEECIYLPLGAYSQPPVSYGEGSGLTGLGTDEVKKATDEEIKRAKQEAAEQPLKVTSYFAGQEVTGSPLQGKGTVMNRLSKESPAPERKNKKTKFEARLKFD